MTPFASSDARRRHYEIEGYLVVRGLFDRASIDHALDEALRLYQRDDLISPKNLRCRYQVHAETRREQLETFDPIIDLSPAIARVAEDARLLAVLAELYGEPACLFKDKLIYKPPGCPGYGLHQDWIGWPGFPRSFLTVLAPLEEATIENGCTIVYPAYHRDGSLTPADGQFHLLAEGLVDPARAVPLELAPGDVGIFSGFTPHRSATNRSSRWRRQLYLSYNQLSDGGQQRKAHYDEFHRWLRGRPEKADSYFA